jgi:hypothetical protein
MNPWRSSLIALEMWSREQEDPSAGLVADEAACSGVAARASNSEVPSTGGATTTHRLSCSACIIGGRVNQACP